MMSRLGKKLLFMGVSAMTALATFQPVSAQTSGVGSDVYTRVMSKGWNSSILLLRVDKNLNEGILQPVVYGPYDGWAPIAMTVAANNYSYILWRRTGGLVSLWKVDPGLNFITASTYGPYFGWSPESLGVDTDGASYLRLIWQYLDGTVDIWCVDPNLNYCGDTHHGLYYDFPQESGTLSSAELPTESAAASTAQMKAAAAMTTDAAAPVPMPHEMVKRGSH
jgi:hypothetical protein